MDIALTWNLFLGFFTLMIIFYSFIIWYDKTIKIILCTYLAALSADWIWNIVKLMLFDTSTTLNVFKLEEWDSLFIILKIVVFILFLVFLSMRWGFEINMPEISSFLMKFVNTFFLWLTTAFLFISVLLIFTLWGSFLWSAWISSDVALLPLALKDSFFVQFIVLNYNFIFVIPIIVFIILSLTSFDDEI